MIRERYDLVFTKLSKRHCQSQVMLRNVQVLCEEALSTTLKQDGWLAEPNFVGMRADEWWDNRLTDENNLKNREQKPWPVGVREEPGTLLPWREIDRQAPGEDYKVELYISITYERRDDKPPEKGVIDMVLRGLASFALTTRGNRWTLSTVNEEEWVPPSADQPKDAEGAIGYKNVAIPENFREYFSHLYGLDAHVGMVLAALEAGLESDWTKRHHVALIGPPGCGKTEICRSLQRALGEDAVMEFDATATTGAGGIEELKNREILPRVVVIEEIEKADDKNLNFLLAILDRRAEIRKKTFRQSIQKETKLFAVATVNDSSVFFRLNKGALQSRFAHKVYFQQPSLDMIGRILEREVADFGGDERWVKATLDYCESHHVVDPREAIAICLSGRDKLLTGEYQAMLEATAPPHSSKYRASEEVMGWNGEYEEVEDLVEGVE